MLRISLEASLLPVYSLLSGDSGSKRQGRAIGMLRGGNNRMLV